MNEVRLTLEFNGDKDDICMSRSEFKMGMTRDQVQKVLEPMLAVLAWRVEHVLNKERFE